MTLAWHVTAAQAASYADGSLPGLDAWSVEKHLEACTPCAARVSAAARSGAAAPALATVRASLLATVTAPDAATPGQAPARPLRRGRSARWAGSDGPGGPARGGAAADGNGPGRSDGTPAATAAPSTRPTGPAAAAAGPTAGPGTPTAASSPGTPPVAAGRSDGARGAVAARHAVGRRGGLRGRLAWAAGPALWGPWLISLLVVAVGAVCAARAAGIGGVRPFLLLLAPVLPSLGVAVSYGRHADPMHEIAASTPSGGLRLLLTRTAAVLSVSVPLLTLAGLLLPATAGAPGAAAWLLPGLALTLAALALGSYVGCRAATGAVSIGWLLAVGAPAAAAPGGPPGVLTTGALADSLATVLSGPAAQGGWAAAAAGCAGLLVLRRTSFDHLERI
ncbi:zf-HC2 domain-containing protein [Streptomyces sp. NPDC021212]|uniref:zf-HC2 domain-containing protein n=1 Tax=Streptomyces sp. NPDC021212 TaxID=3365118 RepID=UPI00379AECBF